ncbi:hypothetical protein N7532_005698 [Penicillium argentinense]|uniref:Ribosome biogenesis protein Alb1 n=1 Tax=Penicillium argentinense TaxID=1131581 RepID=A0A9W9FEG3_9EURO|nr:uncharacterized protein N7532_005698 [Penicillium argentinense]KAJ5098697.1 hypothetical protein N7532_005698 [Penicillium argentinense]
MAKNKPQGQNSRAARRAVSPVDKSLVALPRAESPTTERPTILAERVNAGVQKKKKANKKITRAQRLRQEKGMERAENVLDQLEIKKAKSINRAKNIKTRRAEWEDTNRTANASAFAVLQQAGKDEEDDDDEDDDDDNAMADDTTQPRTTANVFAASVAPAAADPATADEDDEIT